MVTDADLRSTYSETISWLYQNPNVGLNTVARLTVLIWEASARSGATVQQIRNLVLGGQADYRIRKRFSQAQKIAFLWQQNGVPQDVVSANSHPSAVEATLIWFAMRGVSALDDLGKLWVGGSAYSRKVGQVERLSTGIAGALHNKDAWFEYTPMEFAAAIIEKLTVQEAEEFCRGAISALVSKKDSV